MYSNTIIINKHTWYRAIYENSDTNNDTNSTQSTNNSPEKQNSIPEPKYDSIIIKEQTPTRKSFNKVLFTDYPRHVAVAKFMVKLIRMDNIRLFTVFDDYLKFAMYQKELLPKLRSFFETIPGEKSQKPHFDIDIDITPQNKNINFEEIKDCLIEQIISVLESFNIKLKLNIDLIICTSHREDKRSYHIIVNNYSHANNIEAKFFYELVIKNIQPEYKQYIDAKVYSSMQQFRILGSRKIGKENVKIFNEVWQYKGQTIKYMYPVYVESENHKQILQLNASLITTTSNCKILPILIPEQIYRKYDDPNWTGITKEEAQKALQLLAGMNSVSYKDPSFPFTMGDIHDHFVLLKRKNRSTCRICNRIHENENPYLFIIGNQKTVWFDCRRSQNNKKLLVGKLYPENTPDYEDKYGLDKQLESIKELLIETGYDEDLDNFMLKLAEQLQNKNKIKDDEEDDEPSDNLIINNHLINSQYNTLVMSQPVPHSGSIPNDNVNNTSQPVPHSSSIPIDKNNVKNVPYPVPKSNSIPKLSSSSNPVIKIIPDTDNNLSKPINYSLIKDSPVLLYNFGNNDAKPTNLEPNYGMNITYNDLTTNPLAGSPPNSLPYTGSKKSSIDYQNYIPNLPTKEIIPKITNSKVNCVFVDSNFQSLSKSKFDQLDELNQLNSISVISKKQTPKKKPKSTPEQLLDLFSKLTK